jgi:hypothetical protein
VADDASERDGYAQERSYEELMDVAAVNGTERADDVRRVLRAVLVVP